MKACSDLVNGKKLHCWVFKLGSEMEVFVAASLIHMYSRFGSLVVARQIFDDMDVRDMSSWNAMISVVCQYGNAAVALSILDEMRLEGIKMDPVTVPSILPICAQFVGILIGMLIHLYVIKHGLEDDLFVSNAMINMYAEFGLLRHSEKVFHQMLVRDVVSWNSIISASEQKDDPHTAFGFFVEIFYCFTIWGLSKWQALHGYVLRRGWVMKDIIMGNSIMDVFKEIPVRDVVSWNTLITGCAQNVLASEAIEVYDMMVEYMEIIPDQGTWVSIFPAYAHVRALQQGMRICGKVFKTALRLHVFIGTCLIDMYAKCGRFDDAISLFSEVPQESSIPWNAIISSCIHSGLVDQGQWCFHLMQEEYGVRPGLKHYGCMVAMLCRAGQLEKVYEFIKNMPIQPDATIWVLLDRGLRKTPGWTSIEVDAKVDVFYIGNQSHPQCGDIYKELEALSAKMKSLGYIPNYSFVLQDIDNEEEKEHILRSHNCHKELEALSAKMKSLGYIPNYSFVLQDIDDGEEKEHILSSHSERLAIASGIMSTPPWNIQEFAGLWRLP
ncbi:DYW domain [Dillenia turbinata]|uniref:DYW domain n=1 Tax=Dillenia turbinata TaxID=194707 RepID=A0AAN8UP79_9MAGN